MKVIAIVHLVAFNHDTKEFACEVEPDETVSQLIDRLLSSPTTDASEFLSSVELRRVKEMMQPRDEA